jgi:hypothetical protein
MTPQSGVAGAHFTPMPDFEAFEKQTGLKPQTARQ